MKKNKDVDKINEILDTIKPYLINDGGDLEFVKYEDDYVYIKLLGVCHNCEYASDTVNNLIYQSLKNEIPNLKGVISVPL